MLPEYLRREVFYELMKARNGGKAVAESREEVARRFGITEEEVRQIETEGAEQHWPPL